MISIIVPIYNSESYLKPCVDSILRSTYHDFELILVDDGSNDSSGAICDEYAARDSRIIVIHQQNEWLSGARNKGLNVASGKYVSFVDSDDVIHPRMLEVLHDAINSGNYDFSMIYGVWVDDKGCDYDYCAESGPVVIQSLKAVSQEGFMRNLSRMGYRASQYHVVWNKLYKTNLVKDIYFNKLAAEDVEWSTRFCLVAGQGALVEVGLYFYIQHDGSIMHASEDRRIALMGTYHTCLLLPLLSQEFPKAGGSERTVSFDLS